MNEQDYRKAKIYNIMTYLEMEYDNIPDELTPEMMQFFTASIESNEALPNVAGDFYEKFIKKSK